MKKISENHNNSILNKLFSLEDILYLIENITDENIPEHIIQEIAYLYQDSEINTLDEVLFQIETQYAQKIYEHIDNTFSDEPYKKKNIFISDDELVDIIQVKQLEIKNMDISIFCNEVENVLQFSEKHIFKMLDITLAYLKQTNKEVKKLLKERENNKEEQYIKFNDFDYPNFSKKTNSLEHPLFKVKEIYEGKLSYLEESLQICLSKNFVSYYDLLSSKYFYSDVCKMDMFPIPSSVNQNDFFEIISLINLKQKNNFLLPNFLEASIKDYIFDNYYTKKVNPNEKSETILYHDEFSRLSDFQSFSRNLLNLNSDSLKFNFINVLACEVNPANIFSLPQKSRDAVLYELSDTDFLDKFHNVCYQHFPVSRRTIFDNICTQIFNHFDINSIHQNFISLLSKNQSLNLKFGLKIDKNHSIFKKNNQDKLLKVTQTNTAILEHAPLSFWKSLLTSPNFSSIYKSGMFINAPKTTDLYVDEIFTSYINYNNSDYKYLTLSHDTAVKLLVKFYNHKGVLSDLKSNDDEYQKYGNQTHNKYQLSYEKDFFLAILKNLNPSKLSDRITVFNAPSDVSESSILELIISEFNTYGKYYNFDKKNKNDVTEEKYTEEVIHFLSNLHVKTIVEILESSSFSLPEGVFLSAISLQPQNKIKNFLTDFIQVVFNDVILNQDSMTDEQIYRFCSSSNKLESIFKHNKELFSKIPFKDFEDSLITIEKVIYRIQNSEHSSNFDYLVRDFSSKSLFTDAPDVLNFNDLIEVVSATVSKREMLKDLESNDASVVKISKPKIKKF